MNITLLSVTERTREIGLRLAVGARSRDVMKQFLIEAVTISLAGGVAGIILGIIAAALIARTLNWATVVSPMSVLLAFGVAGAVGIFFGWYPAKRASLLDPIVALAARVARLVQAFASSICCSASSSAPRLR